jgi:hypothetical protein
MSGRIYDRAPRHRQTVFRQIGIHLLKQRIPQVALFHQVTKLTDRRLVRHWFPAQVNPGKLAQRLHIVQRFFGTRVREIEPVLHKVNAKHSFHANRAASCSLRIGIMGRDDFCQFLPWNDGLHLSQKLLFAGAFVKLLETTVNKTRLAHSKLFLFGRFSYN